MVVDVNGMSHKPSGLPQGVAGTYEARGGAGADDDVELPDGSGVELSGGRNRTRLDLYERYKRSNEQWDWEESLLKATKPMADGTDYRDEPVCKPEQEMEMRRRAVGDKKSAGYIANRLKSWIPNGERREELAERIVDERLQALRRSCAVKSDHCYSVRLVQSALSRPVRMERIFASYGISAHRMRVGARYLAKVRDYMRRNNGVRPSGDMRDEMWDETLYDFTEEKIRKGKSFGGGLMYSNGDNAHVGRRAHADYVDPETGERMRWNGRKDFETMYEDGMDRMHADCGIALDKMAYRLEGGAPASEVTSDESDATVIRNAYLMAFNKGLDVSYMNASLGISEETAETWRHEWEASRRDA